MVDIMKIIFNGNEIEINEELHIEDLLIKMNMPKRSIVWKDNRKLLFSEYKTLYVKDKDIIKAVRILQGG